MDTRRAARAEELFLAALRLGEVERLAFVARACGDDDELRGEIESLLAHHAAASRFLGEPEIARAMRPERIGPYRVLDVLGEGGMGVVYLAEQESPRRTVALKVIRPGMASPSTLRRLEHEAQLLARLHHPGIAQIHEAGTADYGFGPQPYFAMEHVQGEPLSQYAASHRSSARERLALLADVCDAVEEAHRRGVVHRDLKPSNVLVEHASETARVKVLDFGIARATDEARATSLRTGVGQVVGTLPYMSPEQASGDPDAIDFRSDVYALGAIGYELLCGRLPLDVVGKPLHEAVRIVRDEEPFALSRLAPHLRGDVETIFAKALEKERERRYATAGELGADIRRYLADRPILARPASRAYVVSKFARRNKALVGGVVAVFVALVAGLAGVSWQAWVAAAERARADQSARRAQAVARFQREMLSRVQPELDGRNVKLADVLDAAARSLPGDLAGDPGAEGGVRQMLGQSYHSLGLLEPAERELRLAWGLLKRALGDEHDDTLEALGWLATAVGDLGRLDEARDLSQQAYDALLARHGRRHPTTLIAELNLAQLDFDLDRADEAERIARENLALRGEVFGEDDPRYLNALSVLGQMLWSRGRPLEAEPLLREAFERGRALEGERHPDTPTRAAMLAAVLRELGQLDAAEDLYRCALAVGRVTLGEEHFEVLAYKHNLAALLEQKGELASAESFYCEVLDAHERLFAGGNEDTRIVVSNLARVYEREGRDEQARVLRASWERR